MYMTKADLVEVVAKKASLTAKAARESVAEFVFGAVTDSLKKEKSRCDRVWYFYGPNS